MPLHTANPASARNAETGLGVFCLAAVDTQIIRTPNLELQRAWLAARYGLRADRAKLIAELAFDRRLR